MWTPAPQGQSSEEASALTRIGWFGIISLMGMVASWVIGFYVFGTLVNTSAIAALGPSPTPAQVSGVLGPMFQGMTILIPVSITIEIVGMAFLTLGFMGLKRVDSARFSIPSIMMIILIVGMLIAAAGIIPLFSGIPAIMAQVPSTPTATPSTGLVAALGSVILFAIVAVIGGLLALIGLIGGLILGLWRAGSRYGEPLFKIGAIFVIIPLLDIAAPILILVAARQARGRLPKTQ